MLLQLQDAKHLLIARQIDPATFYSGAADNPDEDVNLKKLRAKTAKLIISLAALLGARVNSDKSANGMFTVDYGAVSRIISSRKGTRLMVRSLGLLPPSARIAVIPALCVQLLGNKAPKNLLEPSDDMEMRARLMGSVSHFFHIHASPATGPNMASKLPPKVLVQCLKESLSSYVIDSSTSPIQLDVMAFSDVLKRRPQAELFQALLQAGAVTFSSDSSNAKSKDSSSVEEWQAEWNKWQQVFVDLATQVASAAAATASAEAEAVKAAAAI